MGASWAPLGRSWAPLERFLGTSRPLLDVSWTLPWSLGRPLGDFLALGRALGMALEGFWGGLGRILEGFGEGLASQNDSFYDS